MRICMVLGSEFPCDIRLEKECEALLNAAHEIHLVARNRLRQVCEDVVERISVHRLRYLPRRLGKLNNWISVPHFLNPMWLFKLLSVAANYPIDIIHVHDLPLTPVGLIVGKLLKIPVVLDNRENYPALLRAVGYRGLVLHSLFNPFLFRFVQMICAKHVAHIICAGKGQERTFTRMGVPPGKLTTLINAVDVKKFSTAETSQKTIDQHKDHFVLVYVGGFGKITGLELPIRAILLLKEKIPNLRLLLVGGRRNPKRRERLGCLCEELGVEEHVIFQDWVDYALVPAYISASAICIAPLVPGEHVNTTTSNKLFEYMCMEKPVIITNVGLMESIVKSENCGIVVRWDDPQEMADAILTLYQNPKYARKLGANGRRAVIQKYNWRKVSKRLVDLYETLGDQ